MFRLKRSVNQPVKWILIIVAIGIGCVVYTSQIRPTTNIQSAAIAVSDSMPTNTADSHAGSESPDESGIRQLTIATWNINYANRNFAEVSRLLRKSNADIVCLQETTESSEAWLKRDLAEQYPYHFIAGHTGEFLAEGFMVLARQPIIEPRFVPPARTFFGHVVFQVNHGETRHTILNVHMTPFTARDSRTITELLSALNQTEMDHQHEVLAILKEIAHDTPTLVLGDFNSPSHGIAPTTLKENGLVDLFGTLYPDADQTHKSWDFRFRNGLHATWRIDYVFHTHQYTARSGELLKCSGSDHHLLVAVFDCDGSTAPLPFRIPAKTHH